MEKSSMVMRSVAMLLAIAMITIVPMVRVLADQSPEEVERWYRLLPHARHKLTKLHFFFHDIVSGSDPTAVEVAQASTSHTSPTFFGLVRVFDDPLRVGVDPNSKLIGYGQGLYVMDSKEIISLLFDLTFVFTEGKFNGSTLVVQGRNPLGQKYRELAITGGSGAFRLARGSAVASTAWANATTQDGIVEFTLIVQHYEELEYVDNMSVDNLRSVV